MAAILGQFPATFRFSGALTHTMCHVSCVTCHMSHVACHLSNVKIFSFHFFYKKKKKIICSNKLDKVVELVGGGYAINRAYHV